VHAQGAQRVLQLAHFRGIQVAADNDEIAGRISKHGNGGGPIKLLANTGGPRL
jgi:hypothetical protein